MKTKKPAAAYKSTSRRNKRAGINIKSLKMRLINTAHFHAGANLEPLLEGLNQENPDYEQLFEQLVERDYWLMMSGLPFGPSTSARYDVPEFGYDDSDDDSPYYGGYLDEKKNLAFIGGSCVGKTKTATGLGIRAIAREMIVQFAPFNNLVDNLVFDAKNTDERKISSCYYDADLLIIDDVGSIKIDSEKAKLVHDLLKRRFKESSTIVTSRIAVAKWGKIFGGNDSLAAEIAHFFTAHDSVYRFRLSKSEMPGLQGTIVVTRMVTGATGDSMLRAKRSNRRDEADVWHDSEDSEDESDCVPLKSNEGERVSTESHPHLRLVAPVPPID